MNQTNLIVAACGRRAITRATSSSAVVPEVLSSEPGPSFTESKWLPTTYCTSGFGGPSQGRHHVGGADPGRGLEPLELGLVAERAERGLEILDRALVAGLGDVLGAEAVQRPRVVVDPGGRDSPLSGRTCCGDRSEHRRAPLPQVALRPERCRATRASSLAA